MSVVMSLIDFKKPRQKMWGIIKSNTLTSLAYGNESDKNGNLISGYATNCYQDCLDQAHDLLAGGASVREIQVVEFVPYDFTMKPNV